jgi:hypothetical protein
LLQQVVSAAGGGPPVHATPGPWHVVGGSWQRPPPETHAAPLGAPLQQVSDPSPRHRSPAVWQTFCGPALHLLPMAGSQLFEQHCSFEVQSWLSCVQSRPPQVPPVHADSEQQSLAFVQGSPSATHIAPH